MNNVTSIASRTASTIDDVKTWLRAMGDKGIFPLNTARLRVTALDALVSIIGDDESRDPKSVLENAESLAARWATKNQGTPATASTYQSRTVSALRDYFAYQQDPAKFKPRRQARRDDDSDAEHLRARSPKKEQKGGSPPVAEPARPDDHQASLDLRNFPISDKGTFWYRLPEEGLFVKDVYRIALHLVTYARDFDPTNPVQSQMFALVRKQES